jgi:hypothetical protein
MSIMITIYLQPTYVPFTFNFAAFCLFFFLSFPFYPFRMQHMLSHLSSLPII